VLRADGRGIRTLNAGLFLAHANTGRPWLRAKLAASLDGRTALASGAEPLDHGEPARRDVHELRARSSAMLTGIGTVLADDPALTVRRPDLRAVPADARGARFQPAHAAAGAALQPARHQPHRCDDRRCARARGAARKGARSKPCRAAMAGPRPGRGAAPLAEREANEVLGGGGRPLNGALLDARLIDELVVYLAPTLLGADSRGMFASRPLATMAERHEVRASGHAPGGR
jgi:diaminohydroxyphosphoribosylaminopyrimidine deaminase/5-amino-6-(5-phosphoribosylamino)uracil reductase